MPVVSLQQAQNARVGLPALCQRTVRETSAVPPQTVVLQGCCILMCVFMLITGCERAEVVQAKTQAPISAAAPQPQPVVLAAELNDGEPPILGWETVEELPKEIAVFQHVFWEPDDTLSLRKLIRETDLVKGKRVLEIGTGSGLVSLCCLQAGADHVLATDINPFAMRNAAYNAEQLEFTDRFEVRLVPQRAAHAWSVVRDDERFDLIISNPPWEDNKPTSLADFALYDPDFQLMRSLLDGLPDRLRPGGRALLAYGCVTAIRTLHKLAEERKLKIRTLDDRSLDDLEELFLPGMLLEVSLQR